jgi:hypothetical protein
MNSRDAAYDEEQLLRALEASREDTIPEEADLAARRIKRIRDDDEESVFPSMLQFHILRLRCLV